MRSHLCLVNIRTESSMLNSYEVKETDTFQKMLVPWKSACVLALPLMEGHCWRPIPKPSLIIPACKIGGMLPLSAVSAVCLVTELP